MFDKVLSFLKGVFAGETTQQELERYIISHNPTDPGQVDILTQRFWVDRAKNQGFF